MVDPQWNILYWWSKWNLHTVCWGAVGCDSGTTSVYFGITYVCLIPCRFTVFAVELQYQHRDILFLLKVSFEGRIQNLQKNSCWFKIWMGFVGPILILSWELLPFDVFFSCLCDVHLGVTYANMLLTTQWPLKRAAHLTSLVRDVWKFNGAICAMKRENGSDAC